MYRPYERPLRYHDFMISLLAVYKVHGVYSVYRFDILMISYLAVYNVYSVYSVYTYRS